MTGIRSILVHLDATAGSVGRIQVAGALAERYGARITALFGVWPVVRDGGFAYSAGAALRAAEQEGMPHELERARLRELLAGHDECVWCEVVGDSVRHGFVAEAAYADLLVLGQPGGASDEGAAPPGFVAAVMLESGTPAIVVPHPYRHTTVGERIVVAWNGSAPASRALKAALPMLQDASSVHVATWGSPLPVAPFSRLDVVAWLRRHGVDAKMHAHDSAAQVAKELAAFAADTRADLVVMGCYGHSRIREQVFGGVTRTSLAALPVPILMSH